MPSDSSKALHLARFPLLGLCDRLIFPSRDSRYFLISLLALALSDRICAVLRANFINNRPLEIETDEHKAKYLPVLHLHAD